MGKKRMPMAAVTHELDAPPWQRVESTLMATSRAIRRAYDQRLGETGLNQSEASLLALVDENGPTSQAEIAIRIGMRRAAAGAIVDGLEGRGLVSRQPHPGDRRTWLIVVTPGAADIIGRVREIDQRLREELRSGISKVERRQLADTLERLRTNLATVLSDS